MQDSGEVPLRVNKKFDDPMIQCMTQISGAGGLSGLPMLIVYIKVVVCPHYAEVGAF